MNPMAPDDVMDVYVPGAWKCLRCGFALSQATLFVGSGEVGCSRDQVMKMAGELCPNDGEPMSRVTWRDRAVENQQWGESLMEDVIGAVGAEHLPGALAAIKRHHAALLSIGASSCCGSCQEAKKVALVALGRTR
jgi:hypothetical protein